MTIYSILAPDGKTYQIEGPPGATQEQVAQAVLLQNPQAGQPPAPESTLKNIAGSAVKGIGSLVQFPGQLMGLATGSIGDEDFSTTGAQKLGADIQKYGEEMTGPAFKAEALARQKRAEEVEKKDGQLAAFGSTLKDLALNPEQAVGTVAEAAANSLPSIVAALIPIVGPGAAAEIKALQLTAQTAASAAARKAAESKIREIAAKQGVAQAIGVGATQQGADIGAGVYEEAYKKQIEDGVNPDVAKAKAIDLARTSGATAGVISLLVQKLPGASDMERLIANRLKGEASSGITNRLVNAGVGGVKEAFLSEVPEEVGGRVVRNVAMQQVDPEQTLMEGTGATAAQAAVGGFGMAGALGLANRGGIEEAPGQPSELQQKFEEQRKRETEALTEAGAVEEPEAPAAPVRVAKKQQIADEEYKQAVEALKGEDLSLLTPRDIVEKIKELRKDRYATEAIEAKQTEPSAPQEAATAVEPAATAVPPVKPSKINRGEKWASNDEIVNSIADELGLERWNIQPAPEMGFAGEPVKRAALVQQIRKADNAVYQAQLEQYKVKQEAYNAEVKQAKQAEIAARQEAKRAEAQAKAQAEQQAQEGLLKREAWFKEQAAKQQADAEAIYQRGLDEGVFTPENERLPGGYRLNEEQFEDVEDTFDLKAGDKVLYTARSAEEAEQKLNAYTAARTRELERLQRVVDEQGIDLQRHQDTIDNLEALGKSGTPEYQAAVARKEALQSELASGDIAAQIEELQNNPVSVVPAGQRPAIRTGQTLYQGDKPVRTFSNKEEAADYVAQSVEDADLEAVAQKQHILAERAKKELQRRAAMKEMYKAMKPLLDRMGLKDVDLQMASALANDADGSYAAKIIKLAADAKDPVRVLRHEGLHALKDLGFFTPQQWSALERMANERWIKKYLADVVHGYNEDGTTVSRLEAYRDELGLSPEEIMEEAIADAFADFDVNGAPPGMLAALLKRLQQFFAALKNAIAGAGFQTAESIFEKADRGELRATKESTQVEEKNSLKKVVPLSTRTIASTEPEEARRSVGLKARSATGKGNANNVREIAAALNNVTKRTAGVIPKTDLSDAASTKLANAIADEVEYQLGTTAETGTGLGWYSHNYPNAVKRLARRFPELADNKHAQSVFTALVAVTSNGEKVTKNIDNAVKLYATLRDGKPLVAMGNRRASALENNLVVIEELLAKYGTDFRKVLLEEITVKDMNIERRAEGLKADGSYLADTIVPKAAVYFGPKLGAFYANLSGSEGYLTMDLWWTRSINRMRGLLMPSATEASISKFREMMGQPNATREQVLEAIIPFRNKYEEYGWNTDLEHRMGSKEPSTKEGKPEWFKQAKRKAGAAYEQLLLEHQMEKMANTIFKNEFEMLQEAPFTASDRKFMYDAANKAKALLRRRNIDLTLADIQAALWYYEKRLYQHLSGRKADDIGYEEAIIAKSQEGDRAEPRSVVFDRVKDSGPKSAGAVQGSGSNRQSEAGRGRGERLSLRSDARGEVQTSERAVQEAKRNKLEPLPGANGVNGFRGPDPKLVDVAEKYAKANGIDLKRQSEYVEVDEERAKRIAKAYADMKHAPQDPAVKEAYKELVLQTADQYQALSDAGYKFWFIDPSTEEGQAYLTSPWNAMRDIRLNKSMGSYPTADGFGTSQAFDPKDNPLLEDTGLMWPVGGPNEKRMAKVYANDLFRVVHDAFGHGLEGAGFRARGEENAWQAHVRLFKGKALGAITTETRGQNSWLNYGPNGEQNQTAATADTVFADQKTGLMPEWTWTEGRAGDMAGEKYSLKQTKTPEFKRWFGDSKVVDADGKPLVVYHGTISDFSTFDIGKSGASNRFGPGFYFTGDKRTFDTYSGKDGGNVMPVYLSMKNPQVGSALTEKQIKSFFAVLQDKVFPNGYDATADQKKFEQRALDNPSKAFDTLLSAQTGYISQADWLRGMEAIGVDGIVREVFGHPEYVVFSPTQIKSAIGNNGNFDPKNPDIRYSLKKSEQTLHPELKALGVTPQMVKWYKQLVAMEAKDPDLLRDPYLVPPGVKAAHSRTSGKIYYATEDAGINYGLAMQRMWAIHNYIGLDALNDPDGESSVERMARPLVVGDRKYSLRAKTAGIQNLGGLNNAVNRVTTPTPPGHTQRMINALTPRNKGDFLEMIKAGYAYIGNYVRPKLLHKYNYIGVNAKRVAELQDNDDLLLADVSAEAAALFADNASMIAAEAMGVNGRDGGIPVYEKGYFKVKKGTKGVVEIFAPLMKYNDPLIYQYYQYWAGAKRGKRFDAEGREKNYTPADFAYAAQLEKAFPEFVNIQKEWIVYNNGLVKLMKDAGVLSERAAAEFIKYGDYVPFYRQLQGGETVGPKIFQAIGSIKAPRELKGSEAPIADFLETIVRNTQAAIESSMKNVAMQRTLRDAEVLHQARKATNAGNANAYVFENGVRTMYEVDDPMLMEAIKGLNMTDIPFLNLAAMPANLLRTLVTKDPAFMLANMMRDSLSSWVTSGSNITPLVGTLTQFMKNMSGKNPDMEDLRRAGVGGGYDFAGNVDSNAEDFGKSIRQKAGHKTGFEKWTSPATGVWSALEHASNASEMATRAAVYKDVLKRTGNEAEAIYQAMEVMNFNRRGNSAAIRILTAVTPFLNARMQGLDVIYRSAFNRNIAKDSKARRNAFIRRAGYLVALSVAYAMLMQDDEEYLKQEQENRDNYWIVPGTKLRIPIPFEIGVLFKVIPERIVSYYAGTDTGKDFVESMTRNLVSTLAFSGPQIVMPIIEAKTNHSFFTGRPIVPDALAQLDPQFQRDGNTTALGRRYGELTGGSPMLFDSVVKGYTGSIGAYVSTMLNAVFDREGDPTRATLKFEQYPIVKRFVLNNESKGSVSAFYALKKETDAYVRTVNILEKQEDPTELIEFMTKNEHLEVTKDYVKSVGKELDELSKLRKEIQISTSISPDEKRDVYIEIDQAMIALTNDVRAIRKEVSKQF